MRKSILCASAALICMGLTTNGAQAQSFAFGVGASPSMPLYRHLMDCFYDQAQGSSGTPPKTPKATHCPMFNSSGFHGLILYAPATSSNAKLVLRTNHSADVVVQNTVTYADSTIAVNHVADYDGIQFAFSDEPLTLADVVAWNAAGNPARFGNIIQIPTMVRAVGIAFNGKDGAGAALNIQSATPPQGSSGLNLSRRALCGIVSGHVTKWNNPLLTATNNNVVLGTGNITFVHRSDSTHNSVLLSSAMAEQCRYEFGPASEIDATVVSYAFPWTDHTAACTGLPLPVGVSQSNWPDQFPVDQCGKAVATPPGSSYLNASSDSGVVSLVQSTNGAIGYASLEYLMPMNLTGPRAANLQSLSNIIEGAGRFEPPTLQAGYDTMAAAAPHFNAVDRGNPLQWSRQGVVADPISPGAYPISGFSWLEMYQCYQTHSNGNNAFLWLRTWLDYYYSATPQLIIRLDDHAFEIPPSWLAEIYQLLNDPTNGLNGSACSGKVGAY